MPTNTARLMMLCPMFNSSISGSAAATVSAEAGLFREHEVIIPGSERGRAARRAHIGEAHHGGADGIRRDWVQPGNEHAGRGRLQALLAAPGAFAAAHGHDAVNDRQMNGACGATLLPTARR